MGRVARALMQAEITERLRDRWVIVVSVLFALLATGVSLYGSKVERAGAAQLTGASLVTLASLLVPLVALILGHDAIVGERERNTLGLLLSLPVRRVEVALAKFLGRLIALAVAIGVGLGLAIAFAASEQRGALARLIIPALELGAAFLSLGVLLSALARRQITAASSAVALWFLLVIFYDLGLLALMVATDGAVGSRGVATLVIANPVGLFRLQMLAAFGSAGALGELGVSVPAPGSALAVISWLGWVLGPLALSALLLGRRAER